MNCKLNKPLIFSSFALSLLGAGVAVAADPQKFEVAITDKGCEPNAVAIGAGDVSFKISNRSNRATEWEILSGVNVVFERENILPGFSQDLKTTLLPGSYQMTCGLRSNPQGTLVASGTAEPKALAPQDFIGMLAEYKVYILIEMNALSEKTKKFTDAVKQNKLEDAQALFAQTRVHYERMEPVAELFGDLDPALDARADDYELKEKDPKFTGFHRIEHALFTEKKTDGMGPMADKLMQDMNELESRVKVLVIEPKAMLDGAAVLIEEVSKTKITGEEDRYSGTDLSDFQGNIDGSMKILDLVRPLLKVRQPELLSKSDTNFGKVNAVLAKYRMADGGFKNYSELAEADRVALKGPIAALAEDLAGLKGALGFE